MPKLRAAGFVLMIVVFGAVTGTTQQRTRGKFHLEEATISQIQQAIAGRQITTVNLVELYLKRIKAYNGTCVNEPSGIRLQAIRPKHPALTTKAQRHNGSEGLSLCLCATNA